MSLASGTRLGTYEIITPLGAGGMGEVYRARDTHLNRDVAVKVLPQALVSDPERVARFTREAQTLAALNHPHIAQIYDFEQSGGVSALVMELVEGDDLAGFIARGPMPLDEALPIARQVAEALEAAHEQDVVHRDLKPANVRVRPDGTVKVLDFGLAKAVGQGSPVAQGFSPADTVGQGFSPADTVGQGFSPAGQGATVTSPALLTQHGIVLGTAAYMSPEQARGKRVDRRTDVWAFGCLLYEMLSGRGAFAAETVTDTLAKVIERDPDWAVLPASVPPHVRAVIERCLRKDPARRLRDIGDARLQLDEDLPVAAPLVATAAPRRARWRTLAVVAAALAAGTTLGWYARRAPADGPPAARPVRLDLLLPSGLELFTISGTPISIAPDGSRLAYVAGGARPRQVFIRALDATESVALRGTEAAVAATFSPDGQSLGVLARDRSVKRISLGDGLITDVASYAGMNAPVWGNVPLWGGDGTLVFSREGLWRVPISGGEPVRLTTLDASHGEVAHTVGAVLPSGMVLFTSWSGGGDRVRIEAVDADGGRRRTVVDRASAPLVAATGHLLFHRDGAMLAAPFDAERAQTTGEAVMVVPPGVIRWAGAMPIMALSKSGTLVYAPAQTGLVRLVRVSRTGATEPLTDAAGPYSHPRVSPDGTQVVLEQAGDSLWIQDLTRDARTPLTGGQLPGVGFPIWTRDGRRIVFRRSDQLRWVDASGTGRTQSIAGEPADIPAAITPDGSTLVVLRTSPTTSGDLYGVPLTGSSPERPIVKTPGYDGGADFSPDGRWLAYASTDSGPSQVYLAPYPAMDRKWSVSTKSGTQPRWNRNGRELFYRDGDRMMAVGVDTSRREPRLSAPRLLFEREFASGAYVTIPNYDVTGDGQFVMMQAEPGAPRLTVVVNWFEELKRLLAAQPR